MNRVEFGIKILLKAKRRLNKTGRLFGATPYEYFYLNERKFEIRHRGTRADREAIQQCLWQKQYEIPTVRGELGGAVTAFHKKIISQGGTPLIIDGGANIGASTLWFATRYPRAHIVAIEPAPNNCEILVANTKLFDVDVRQAGLSTSEGIAVLADPGFGAWGYRTEATGEGIRVPMTTLENILSATNPTGCVPFILKLDIEGSEKGLFDGEDNVARKFPVIIIEPHDWMLPHAGTSHSFLRFHVDHGRDFISRGEKFFSIDYDLLSGAH